MSHLENQFQSLWDYNYPTLKLIKEAQIIPNRKYRFDFVHLSSKVAIEINGGIYSKMGHSTGKGITRDYTKNNLAIACGWVVFQLSSEMVNDKGLSAIAKVIRIRLTRL